MFNEFRQLLIMHMMRSVNDRYAVFSSLGFDVDFLTSLNLEGSAFYVGMNVGQIFKDRFGEKVETYLETLKKIPLPEWMNDK